MKKVIKFFVIILLLIVTLIWFIIAISLIMDDSVIGGVVMILIYIILAFLIYAAIEKRKIEMKSEVKESILTSSTNKKSTQFNYNENSVENYEDLDDEENSFLFSTSYGDWKHLSFGFGRLIKLSGVTYGNRQKNIEELRKHSELLPKYFLYNNEPSIEIFHNENSIGFVPKEMAPELTDLKEFVQRVVVKEVIGGSGKNYGLIIDFRLDNDAEQLLSELYRR